jgi:hypothetical protein
MVFMRVRIGALGVLGLAVAWGLLAADPLADLKKSFEHPPDNARIMVRWWWFGPSVTKPELERELRTMKEGGIGGVEVQATYPLALDDPSTGFHNFKYLSPEFLDDLAFTGQKAKELGLRMDLTLGSGWPYGGPHISIDQAAGRLRVARPTNGTLPKLADGEKLIAVFADGQQVADPSTVTGEGHTFQFFIASHTRMMVKRPAVGAEGLVLDHYDHGALDSHLKAVGEPMLKALASTPPHSIFSDSLEVQGSEWTPNFLEEFANAAAMTCCRTCLRWPVAAPTISWPAARSAPPLSGTIGVKLSRNWRTITTSLRLQRLRISITLCFVRRVTAHRPRFFRATRFPTCPRARARSGESSRPLAGLLRPVIFMAGQ